MLRYLRLPPISVCSTVLLLLSLAQSSICFPGSPSSQTVIPAPIVYPPSQNWEGVDGTWNTFVVRVGTPAQPVRVQISTCSQQTWVVDPRGCPEDTAGNSTCAEARGSTFNLETSTTWNHVGMYELGLEKNLGLDGVGEYGLDTVALGYQGESGITLQAQIVGALATDDFRFGHFGLDAKSTNWSSFDNSTQSLMHDLKAQNMIPSLSWGYTAGAPYRFTKVPGSLTLGGYDSSKFISNNVVFPMSPNNERDIVVSIESITSIDSSGTKTSLLPKPVYAFIDSTIAEIWLPIESCVVFEKTFGLTWDPVTQLYLLSDAVHNQLLVTNPNITLNIAPWTRPAGNADNVNIMLPYSAFDLTAKPPYQTLNSTSRYFPLRRSANDSQYTLGRTFFQEAYLTVDWERQNFSVSQVSWIGGAQSRIVPIQPLNSTRNGTAGGANGGAGKMSPLSPGAIAGVVVGVVLLLLLTAAMAICCLQSRKRRSVKTVENGPSTKTVDTDSSKDEEASGTTLVFPKAELPAETAVRAEADGTFYGKDALGRSVTSSTAPLVESDSKEREVFEMEGDMPSRQEADGRQLTEKDAMKAREERINGVDPSVHSPVSGDQSPTSVSDPSTLDTNRRRALLTPGDIIELSPIENRTLQPISPLDGSDGSRTNLFSPISPGGATLSGGVSPDTARKRFSYEDP